MTPESKVPISVMLMDARDFEELERALAAFINDLLEREMHGGEPISGGDMAFIIGATHGAMSRIIKDSREGPYCSNPECTFTNGKGRVFRSPLETIEDNFSGTGIDIMYCKRCEREYNVSYAVSKIWRVDSDTGEPVQ